MATKKGKGSKDRPKGSTRTRAQEHLSQSSTAVAEVPDLLAGDGEPDESEQAFNRADATSQDAEGLQTGVAELTDQATPIAEAVATTTDEEPRIKSAAQKRWREKNRPKVQEYQKKWREKNKDKVKAIHTAYRKKNPEKVKAWQKASQDRRKAASAEKAAVEPSQS